MYGLFNGSLIPTKTGTWTLYGGNGQNSIAYSSLITVTYSSTINITLSYTSTYPQLLTGDSINLTSHIADIYGNIMPNESIQLSITGVGSPTLTQPPPTDSNGNTIVAEGPFVAGSYQITGSLGSSASQPLALSVTAQVATTVTVSVTPSNLPNLSATWFYSYLQSPYPSSYSASGDSFVVSAHVTNQRGLPMSGAVVTIAPTSISGSSTLIHYTCNGTATYYFSDSSDTTEAYVAYMNPSTFSTIGPYYTTGTYLTDINGNASVTLSLYCQILAGIFESGSADVQMTGSMDISVDGTLEKQWSFSIS